MGSPAVPGCTRLAIDSLARRSCARSPACGPCVHAFENTEIFCASCPPAHVPPPFPPLFCTRYNLASSPTHRAVLTPKHLAPTHGNQLPPLSSSPCIHSLPWRQYVGAPVSGRNFLLWHGHVLGKHHTFSPLSRVLNHGGSVVITITIQGSPHSGWKWR